MVQILRILFSLLLLSVKVFSVQASDLDARKDWRSIEDVARLCVEAINQPKKDSAVSLDEAAAMCFGVREVERVIEDRRKLLLSTEEGNAFEAALIHGQSARQIAILGCVMCISKTNYITIEAVRNQLYVGPTRQIVDSAGEQRDEAVRSLKLLSRKILDEEG